MSKLLSINFFAYLILALFSLMFGLIYLTKNRFIPEPS